MANTPTTIASEKLPDTELEALFSGPAVFANKIYLTGVGMNVRLTFTEQLAGRPPIFRAAVLLAAEDAVKLRDLIDRMIAIEKTTAPKQATNG